MRMADTARSGHGGRWYLRHPRDGPPPPHPDADRPRLDAPEGGGTGTVLYGQVSRWIAWGHRVTVIAGSYEGAEKVRARTSC